MKLAVLILAVLLDASAVDSASASAEEHYEKATIYYNLQDWANALKEYRLSYEIDPKPGTLWAIAQAQRLSGDCRAAILTYRAYARSASPVGAAAADEHVARCQTALEEQRRAVEQAANARQSETARTPPSPQAARPAGRERERRWYADPLGDVLFATGMVGVALGAFYLRRGNADMREAPHAANYGAYEEARDTARREERAGVAALSAGLAVSALSVVRFALLVRHRDRQPQARVGVTPAARGGELIYRITF